MQKDLVVTLHSRAEAGYVAFAAAVLPWVFLRVVMMVFAEVAVSRREHLLYRRTGSVVGTVGEPGLLASEAPMDGNGVEF